MARKFTSNSGEPKKSVDQIIVDEFLKDVDALGKMPWQEPYRRYLSFNWATLNQYHGFNRLFLPNGEYLTMNQIKAYNKSKGTNYRYAKKTEHDWWCVVFFKTDTKDVSQAEFDDLKDSGTTYADFLKNKGILRANGWFYRSDGTKVIKTRNIMRYTRVADRSCFVDEEKGVLPSRLESGEVLISHTKPKEIFDHYISKSHVKVESTNDVPCYVPSEDAVYLNKHARSEDDYWSSAFHELGHSTMTKDRCNREYWKYFESLINKTKLPLGFDKEDEYAKEECIAEIIASLACAECDIHSFNTSGSKQYKNNLAYVQSWKTKIKDWGKSFIYVVSQAEKGYQYLVDGLEEATTEPTSDSDIVSGTSKEVEE